MRDYEEVALGEMAVCHAHMEMYRRDCGIHLYLKLRDCTYYTPDDSDKGMYMAQQDWGVRRHAATEELGVQTAKMLNYAAPYLSPQSTRSSRVAVSDDSTVSAP